jgi:F-type H+-transporting ATPase subunit delta
MSNCSGAVQISRRYARALFELIQEGSPLTEDLAVVAAVAASGEAAELLASTEYPAKVKQSVLLKATAGKLSKEIERLVVMLCERNKSVLLPEIHLLVEEMIRQAESEVDAEVVVATEMDEILQQKLASALEASTGKKVHLNYTTDKNILGGMVITIGDRKIDYSLRTKLNGLRRVLAS